MIRSQRSGLLKLPKRVTGKRRRTLPTYTKLVMVFLVISTKLTFGDCCHWAPTALTRMKNFAI